MGIFEMPFPSNSGLDDGPGVAKRFDLNLGTTNANHEALFILKFANSFELNNIRLLVGIHP